MINVEKSYTINQLMRFSKRELIGYIKNLERQRNQLNKVVDKLLENSTSHVIANSSVLERNLNKEKAKICIESALSEFGLYESLGIRDYLKYAYDNMLKALKELEDE